MPDSLKDLFKHHREDLMKRGIRNQSLFEAYVEYCFSPKHTVGEQLLDVRRDKRERAAFAALGQEDTELIEEEEDSNEGGGGEDRYCFEMTGTDTPSGDASSDE
jgi:hypothetical protein